MQVKTTGHESLEKPKLGFVWDAYIYVNFNDTTSKPYDDAKIQVYARPDGHTVITRNWKRELMNLDESTLDNIARATRARKCNE